MKKIQYLIVSLLCFFCINVAFAEPDPMVMLKQTTDQLISSLKTNNAQIKRDPTFVYGLVNKILLPKVNVQVMSMSVLGRNAWAQATPAQRTQFTKEFTTTVIKTYASALNAYTNQTIQFMPIRGGYQGRKLLQVNSQIVRSDGPPVAVSYSLVLQGSQWRIYDLSVEGISLLQSFRSQFASELAQGKSVAQIITDLQQHNAKMK